MAEVLTVTGRKAIDTVLFFIIIMAALFLQGCSSSKVASYHYSQTQIEQRDINFHKTIRVDEYINAFPQEWLQVPEGQDITLRVDPFTRYQPVMTNTTLIQVAVKTKEALINDVRKPVGICFVLDKSGSMIANIRTMMDAVIQGVMEMNEGDEVAVVVFDYFPSLYIPAQPITKESRIKIVEKLKLLSAEGGTNIQDGLIMGYKEMSRFKVTGHKRLLLITDGRSTVWFTSPQELASRAESEYIKGARISTIGLGYEVDEKSLRRIALEGNGHYYFAESSTYLKSLLVQDLQSTLHPVAKDVSLSISASEGFRLLHVYGAEDSKMLEPVNSSITVDIGELNINDWRILLAEVEGNVPPGEYQPVSAELVYTGIESPTSSILNATSALTWQTGTPGAGDPVNPDVALNGVLYGNAATLIKTGELATERRYRSALEILDMQIQNNIIIKNGDNAESIDKEIGRLSAVRDIITNISGESPPKAWSAEYEISDEKKSQLKDLAVEGAMASTEFLPGIWSTVAQILLILVL